MSDLGEITALVHSYALLLDAGDTEAVAALFAYSTWRSDPAGRILRGTEEIRPVYEQLKSSEGDTRTKHLLTNLTVDVEPEASIASAHCYWTVLQNMRPGSPISILLSGQYTDTFEKVDGAWCFSDRLITVDLTGDTSTHFE